MRGRAPGRQAQERSSSSRTANLPDVLARPGEPWERTETLGTGGQEFSFRKKYEYAGTEKKGDKTLDKITAKMLEVKIKQHPNDAVAARR